MPHRSKPERRVTRAPRAIARRSAWPWTAVACCVATLFALTGCSDPHRPSVVLITIDTLRADHLGCYGYVRDTSPVIDRFAEEAILFENVVTSMSTTLPAHTSLLTSSYPVRNGVYANYNVWGQSAPTDQTSLRSVAELFQQAGYRTGAFVSVFHLGPGSGVDTGFETHNGVRAGLEGGDSRDVNTRPADETTNRALAWLESVPTAEPFFLWVHYFDPHSPYRAPDPYFESFDGVESEAVREFIATRDVPLHRRPRSYRQSTRYDEEIRFVDDQVNRLFQALREQSRYDESVLILTADHGEGLFEHNILEHGPIYQEQVLIPLIMKFPGDSTRAGLRVPEIMSILDVFPTAIAAADLPLSTASFDGIDILSDGRRSVLSEREHTKQRFGTEIHYTLTTSEWKYFYYTESPDRLYRLSDDPHESHDVIDDHPEVAESMRVEILELVHENQKRGASLEVKREVSPELRNALEGLGYVD